MRRRLIFVRGSTVLEDPRTILFGLGRSVLAATQLGVLLSNGGSALFGSPVGPRAGCDGVGIGSLWCVGGGAERPAGIATLIACGVLLVVAAGYRPRWSCVPHWYVSVSMNLDLTPANGGEAIAQSITMIAMFVCLADSRRWHWSRPSDPLPPRSRGQAAAALLVMRCQLAIVYLEAACAKLAFPSWRHGSALQAVFRDPIYGLPRGMLGVMSPLIDSASMMHFAGYAVIGTELLISCCMIGPARFRRIGLALVCILHVGIIVSMGLFSFGVIMCAASAMAVGGTRSSAHLTPSTVTEPTEALHAA